MLLLLLSFNAPYTSARINNSIWNNIWHGRKRGRWLPRYIFVCNDLSLFLSLSRFNFVVIQMKDLLKDSILNDFIALGICKIVVSTNIHVLETFPFRYMLTLKFKVTKDTYLIFQDWITEFFKFLKKYTHQYNSQSIKHPLVNFTQKVEV